jgi:putative transposase
MMPFDVRRGLIEKDNPEISTRHQCELLNVHRSNVYYVPREVSSETLAVMRAIDREYTSHPFYGIRKITHALHLDGWHINHKRVAALMKLMGLEAIAPKPNLSKKAQENRVFPYLLRNVSITAPNQVWSTDITYIPMRRGFMYCTAVIDWFSRFVLAWEISNTLDTGFCVTVVQRAFELTVPEIFNTDQGSQYTSDEFIGCLTRAKVRISMDGRGRALDNVFIERLWRSLKYEKIYLHEFEDGYELKTAVDEYFTFFNHNRFHAALGNATPAQVYYNTQLKRVS